MRIDWDTPVSALMHSDDDIYYVDLAEDEMVHFKYIKREKLPNGRYRYYYSQSELDKLKATADRKQAAASAAEASYKDSLNRAGQPGSTIGHKVNTALKYQSMTIRQRAAEKAVKKYNRKKIISFPARAISKGVVAVANFVSGLFGKKKKK